MGPRVKAWTAGAGLRPFPPSSFFIPVSLFGLRSPFLRPGPRLTNADANALGCKIDMNARCPVDAARSHMCGADLRGQCGVGLAAPRRLPFRPCVIAAGGDTHQPAHGGDREGGLILAHEPEPFDGIVFFSRANHAAA